MANNPACQTFWPSLSPFVDGELPPTERVGLERHLANCSECTGRVADFRAEAGLVRLGMEMLTDEADFTGFAQKVMARVTPQQLPIWERMRLAWDETWTYQRGRLVTGFAMAAVLLVMVPVGLRLKSGILTLPAHMAVRSITVDPRAHVAPVVMTNDETGDSIIWLVDHDDRVTNGDARPDDSSSDELPPDENQQRPPAGVLQREKPSGGDL